MWVNVAALGPEVERFTFNGVSSDTLNMVVESKKINPPQIRERYVELPNRPGAIDLSFTNPLSRFGRREIDVISHIVADSRSDEDKVKRNVMKSLSVFGEAPLIFSHTSDRKFNATLGSIEFENVNNTFGLTLVKCTKKFVCSSPFALDASGDVVVADALVGTIENTGDIVAEAVFTLTLSAATSSLVLNIGTNKIQFDRSFVVGDKVQVGNGVAILNGSQFLVPNMLQSNSFLEIPVGSNTFTSNTTCTASLTFRRRYMHG
jgi:phage-related protein